MKPLDLVKTPKGAFAIVTETNNGGTEASIDFIGPNPARERNAWWGVGKLEFLSSLPRVLALATAHPFGSGRDDVDGFYPAEPVEPEGIGDTFTNTNILRRLGEG